MRIILGNGGHAGVIKSVAPDAKRFDAADGLSPIAGARYIIGFVGDFLDRSRAHMSHRLDAMGMDRWSAVSDCAFVDADAEVLDGCYIGPNAVLERGVKLRRDCVVLSGAVVSHDCVLQRDCFVGPGAVLCGGVTTHGHVRIGAGAVVLPGLTLGEHAVIGAGVTVRRDVRDGEVYAP